MRDLNALDLTTLFDVLTRDGVAEKVLRLARMEDLGERGDVTSLSIVDPDAVIEASLVMREPGVVSGMAVLPILFQAFEVDIEASVACPDGESASGRTLLATLRGSHRAVLAIERTMLNLVGRMIGISTLTRHYVKSIAGTHAVVCDTRKTTPGLRAFEKYAVRCGGATLHRQGLWDAALYKDNHLAGVTLDALTEVVNRSARAARDAGRLRFVEVEVDSLAQLERVLACDAGLVDILLLDNMSDETMREAVRMRDARGVRVLLEASGGVTLERMRSIAEAGVDRISVGALTHHAVSADVALDIGPPSGISRTDETT